MEITLLHLLLPFVGAGVVYLYNLWAKSKGLPAVDLPGDFDRIDNKPIVKLAVESLARRLGIPVDQVVRLSEHELLARLKGEKLDVNFGVASPDKAP